MPPSPMWTAVTVLGMPRVKANHSTDYRLRAIQPVKEGFRNPSRAPPLSRGFLVGTPGPRCRVGEFAPDPPVFFGRRAWGGPRGGRVRLSRARRSGPPYPCRAGL